MTPRLVDAHTHIQFAAFDNDRNEAVSRALDAGVWLINVGTQKDTSKFAVELAHLHEGVFAAVGLHPIHTEKSFHDESELGGGEAAQEFTSRGEEFDFDYYKNLAQDFKVVAIGECGLDYYHLTAETRGKQANAFRHQITLAKEIKKPLMIHCRDAAKLKESGGRGEAFKDLISILNKDGADLPQYPGIIHFFSGTIGDAKELMNMGFCFSFGGALTFARAFEKLVKFIPLDRIVLETDAPYVAPQAYRGKRNEPLYVEEVAKKIARVLSKDFDEIARVTTENAIRVFNIR